MSVPQVLIGDYSVNHIAKIRGQETWKADFYLLLTFKALGMLPA